MADNIPITAGSGTNVATDDVSGVHYQRVKLVESTADSSTATGVAGNPLQVSLANTAANATAISVTCTTDKADDAAFSVATDKVNPVGFLLDDTSTDSVNEGDVGIARMTADRRQIVVIGESQANSVSNTASATATTSTLLLTGAASLYMKVGTVVVHNSSTTDTFVTLQDGSGGTGLAVLPAPAKGGCVVHFDPPLKVPTSGNSLYFAAGTGVTTLYMTATGYKSTAA